MGKPAGSPFLLVDTRIQKWNNPKPMQEKEGRQLSAMGFELPSPVLRLERSVEQSAHYWNLDNLTLQTLLNFTMLNYRIRMITEDFTGTTTEQMVYVIHPNEKGNPKPMIVNRSNYRDLVKTYSMLAYALYNEDLNSNEATRTAAREVQRTVDDLFPKIPLADFPAKTA